MFRTVPLSIIRSFSLCVQWKTPDGGQRNCPKHVELYSKNKFDKLVHLVGFIIRIYHDARSPEHQNPATLCTLATNLHQFQLNERSTPNHLVVTLWNGVAFNQVLRENIGQLVLLPPQIWWAVGSNSGLLGDKRTTNRLNLGMARRYIRAHGIPSTERTHSGPRHSVHNFISPYLWDPFRKVEVLTAQTKDSGRLGYHTVSLGSFWQFKGAQSAPDYLTPENKGSTNLRNTGNYTTSYSGSLAPPATPTPESQISQ